MVEDEIAQCVSSLDWVSIRSICFKILGVIRGNEIQRRLVGPELFSHSVSFKSQTKGADKPCTHSRCGISQSTSESLAISVVWMCFYMFGGLSWGSVVGYCRFLDH